MTMKSMLLGTVAVMGALGGAKAADLPMTRGEAVEYVKVCSAFGPGFFYIPGTDTCLKIGGEVRADYRVFGGRTPVYGDKSRGFSRDDNRSAFNSEGRIWFDARTETGWGLLRSYFQVNATTRPIYFQGRGANYTINYFAIDKAFIQFGGLMAGYAHSFFGFYDNEYGSTIWAPYYAQSSTVNLLAYTAQFGGGLSATVAVEDGRDHRTGIYSITTIPRTQGGQQLPDLVGQVRLDQGWGSLAAQAALHQYRTNEAYGAPRESKWGYAVGGTALIKIPAIANGHLIVEGQYADGALQYLGDSSSFFWGGRDGFRSRNGRFESAKGWSVVAELGGNLMPDLNANLVGSYLDTRYDKFFAGGPAADADYGLKEFMLAGNLTYTIVKGLTLSGEVAYTRVQQDNVVAVPPGSSPDEAIGYKGDRANVWQTGIRIKRTF
ncbi:porin [Labrys portucalensis]|uniref:Porin n=1 Tax=Labrys neptuniae TaxID=376174 RepID=A0ABV6ZE09_9HYPH